VTSTTETFDSSKPTSSTPIRDQRGQNSEVQLVPEASHPIETNPVVSPKVDVVSNQPVDANIKSVSDTANKIENEANNNDSVNSNESKKKTKVKPGAK
jgi:IMP cyclohydrolase